MVKRSSGMRSVGVLCLLLAGVAAADVRPDVRDALLRRDYTTAVRLLAPLAQNGDRDALFELGRLYERGLGTTQDAVRAFDCYRRAASQGQVDAMYLTAVMLDKGRGTAADPQAAREWYRRAAKAGHVLAQKKLEADSADAPAPAGSLFDRIEAGDPAALAALPADVDVDELDSHGRLALDMAVSAGNAAMVDALLARGANPNVRDATGSAPLHRAASLGSAAAGKAAGGSRRGAVRRRCCGQHAAASRGGWRSRGGGAVAAGAWGPSGRAERCGLVRPDAGRAKR